MMYSNEHLIYLKKIRRNKFCVFCTQICIFITFLLVWELLAKFELINTFIISSPSRIIQSIINLHNQNNLYQHILITLYETILSFSIGTIGGLIIAAILWWNSFLAKVFDPYLTILNSLPKVALGPIIIIWFGAGIKSIIIMALLISMIVAIMNTYQSFKNTDHLKTKLLKSFKANKMQIFTKLVLPNSISDFINTIKINISMCLIGVIMGEFLVSKSGIGYLIMYGSQVFNLNLVFTGIILLIILSTILYYLIIFLEKKIVHN